MQGVFGERLRVLKRLKINCNKACKPEIRKNQSMIDRSVDRRLMTCGKGVILSSSLSAVKT